MLIDDIRSALLKENFRVSDHADEESKNDNLVFEDILFSVMNGEIIENYPDDRPFPSCLIYGKNSMGEPIHTVWGYKREKESSVLITVYRPDPERWIDFKERKK